MRCRTWATSSCCCVSGVVSLSAIKTSSCAIAGKAINWTRCTCTTHIIIANLAHMTVTRISAQRATNDSRAYLTLVATQIVVVSAFLTDWRGVASSATWHGHGATLADIGSSYIVPHFTSDAYCRAIAYNAPLHQAGQTYSSGSEGNHNCL